MFVLFSPVGKYSRQTLCRNFLVASLFLLLVHVSPGSARTLSVPESSPTIKGALIKAQPGDIVLVACGTYFEHDITMKPGVALWSGTLQPGCVTIDAQGKGQVFQFSDADTNTALVGFTLRGGLASSSKGQKGGAISCRNSSPRISNCVFMDNAADRGGALFSDSESFPVLANCLFENNDAVFTGGGAHIEGSSVFRQCAFVGNQAMVGGGLNIARGALLKLVSCSIRENSAGNTGGALHLVQAQGEITNTIFSDNWGGLGGSALSSQDSELKIVRSTLFRNLSDTEGGVIAFTGQRPHLQNSIIAFSQSPILRADCDVPVFRGCNLYGNESGDWTANLRSLKNKNDNISQDPQFCAPEFGNFSLKNSSACLPGNNPSGNKRIVGAFGPGCASVENMPKNKRQSNSGFQAVQAGL